MSCPACFQGAVHDYAEARGHEETIHGIATYIASGPSAATSQSTIIFFCDALGYTFINNRLLADQYAELTGFRVLVPDVIPGGGCNQNVLGAMDAVSDPVKWWDIRGQLRRVGAALMMIRYFLPFILRALPSKALPATLEYTRKVKASLPPGAKLGVCGFCWGGYQSTNLCAESAVAGGSERLIDAQFCAHPSQLKAPGQIVDAITKFNVPYSLAHGSADYNLTTKSVEEAEAILRRKEEGGNGERFAYDFRIYKDCHHGFAARAKPGDKVEAQGMEDAKIQAVEWFKKWL